VPAIFSRSLRSIEADGYHRPGFVFALALALGVVWTGWFVTARVAVIEVAETARLEVDQAAHGIEAAVGGRVTSSRLILEQEVQAGDVLMELDAEPLRLSLGEEKAKQAAFSPQIAALGQEIDAGERALEEQRSVTKARVDEAEARRREAETAADLAGTEARRAARLFAESLASESEAVKAKAESEQKRAVADETKLATTRIEVEQRANETELRARLARLHANVAQLEGQRAMSAAAVQQLEYEIERRKIRAPIAGRLGEIAPVRVGGVVKEGERLGAVIPAGQIRIVSEFLPAAAIGRIRPGQSARMRPEGFPWTEYGVLGATVRRVATEPRSGRIRVELDLAPRAESRIPMQHGLPGTLEIEVERASPAALVFRAAGRRLAAPARNTETRSDSVEGPTQTPAGP
jgi:membrane fusion protein (multidrug efflux system)